jgi:hypothetical protein
MMFSDYSVLLEFIELLMWFGVIVVVGVPMLGFYDVVKGWLFKK